MKLVLLRPTAVADRLHQIRHYRTVAGTSVANDLVESLRKDLRFLQLQPGSGSTRLGQAIDLPTLRTWPVSGFPLLIAYFDQTDHIELVRILGQRHDVASILGSDPTLGG